MRQSAGAGYLLSVAASLALVAGCAGTAAVGPTALATAISSSVPIPTLTSTPTGTPAPTPSPTFPSDPDPSHMPAGFIEGFAQLDEVVGGHGGSPAVNLPDSVAIDYWVSGTCDFRIEIAEATGTDSTPLTTFAMRMRGSTVSGTWPVSVKAGQYFVTPLDAPGCRFSVTVRAAP